MSCAKRVRAASVSAWRHSSCSLQRTPTTFPARLRQGVLAISNLRAPPQSPLAVRLRLLALLPIPVCLRPGIVEPAQRDTDRNPSSRQAVRVFCRVIRNMPCSLPRFQTSGSLEGPGLVSIRGTPEEPHRRAPWAPGRGQMGISDYSYRDQDPDTDAFLIAPGSPTDFHPTLTTRRPSAALYGVLCPDSITRRSCSL